MDRFLKLFHGRLNRQPYVLYTIMMIIVAYVIAMIGIGTISMMFMGSIDIGLILGLSLFLVLEVLMLILGFSVTIRRLHDIDKSGWWSLFAFVPIASFIMFIALCFIRGTDTENKYGRPVINDDSEQNEIFKS